MDMSIRRLFVLGWMAAGLQILSAAQTPTPQSPPAQNPGDNGAGARTAPAAALSGIAGLQTESDTGKIELFESRGECGRNL